MVKVVLENASNGVIKRVKDDNHNGSGMYFTLTKLYEIDRDSEYASLQSFQLLGDIINDLDLDLGNEQHAEVLNINSRWGEKYMPTPAQIKAKIKELRSEIDQLKELMVISEQAQKK
jgi:hypothetical protein